MAQDDLMRFDPATGAEKPYPSHAEQWRRHHGVAWLFNPWTGTRRAAGDVALDVFGRGIHPGGPMLAAKVVDSPIPKAAPPEPAYRRKLRAADYVADLTDKITRLFARLSHSESLTERQLVEQELAALRRLRSAMQRRQPDPAPGGDRHRELRG